MAFTVKAYAIMPKPLDMGKMEQEIGRALIKEGERDAKTLRKTTDGWTTAPPIDYEIEISAKEASVWIGPWGTKDLVEKWRRIDEGLPEHSMDSATVMKFPWKGRGVSYDAKTTPREFSSKANYKKLGERYRRTRRIEAHYITPREWSKTLAEQRIGPFAADIQAAINRALS